MTRFIVVTGTDTGVGKTVATAWLAVQAMGGGSVLVVKPAQTGIDPVGPGRSGDLGRPVGLGDSADVDEVRRLSGCAVTELVRLPDPLAPDTAARLRGVRIPTVIDHAERIHDLAGEHETVIVEGSGGLLVRLDTEGGTLLDLVEVLGAEVYVVCRAGLGTLNHTQLTADALRARGIEPDGLIIGAWPAAPDLAARCNRDDLPRLTGVPLVGVLPDGAGALTRPTFRRATPSWIVPNASQPNRPIEPARR